MLKLSNLLKSFAVKNWQKYSFKQEWATVIVLLIVLKLATSAVSIFSGFFYLENFFFSFTDNLTASRIFAIISLVIVEGLCTLFCAKFFKFALRLDFKTAILPLVCAVLVFAVSFIISCNGIALYANKAEDLTKDINAKYNAMINNAQSKCDADIKQMHEYIETLKRNPQGWSGGQRCMLSDFQTQEVAKSYENIEAYKRTLSTTIKDIEKQRNIELAENNKTTIDTADKYYKIVSFIMIVQVICSAGLWFFWCKIAAQDAPENDYKESIMDVYNKANNLIDKGLETCISQKFSIITTAFSTLANDMKMKEIAATNTQKNVTVSPRRTGFTMPETSPETPSPETANNATTVAVSDVANVNTTRTNTVAVCAECGKPLTESQVIRKARFCCPKCRVTNYNKSHPERKKIIISDSNLKD